MRLFCRSVTFLLFFCYYYKTTFGRLYSVCTVYSVINIFLLQSTYVMSNLKMNIFFEDHSCSNPFYASFRVKHTNPRPSLSPKHGKMPIRVTTLAFDLFVLH